MKRASNIIPDSWVHYTKLIENKYTAKRLVRGGSRAAATSKMDCFVIIVNGFQPLTIITKHSILDVLALDSPLLVKLVFYFPV